MGYTTSQEMLIARWTDLVNDPSLDDLPYKIELNAEDGVNGVSVIFVRPQAAYREEMQEEK